eukprot:7310409-Prymnesium_polylepis.1
MTVIGATAHNAITRPLLTSRYSRIIPDSTAGECRWAHASGCSSALERMAVVASHLPVVSSTCSG